MRNFVQIHPRAKREQRPRYSLTSLGSLALLLAFLLSGCGGTGQASLQMKAKLDAELQHAVTLGVPQGDLQPIDAAETQTAGATGPFGIFATFTAPSNLATRYQLLYTQVLGVEAQATDMARYQAHQELDRFAAAVQQQQGQGFREAAAFAARLNQEQQHFAQVDTPAEYGQITAFAQGQVAALEQMAPTYGKLQEFQNSLAQMSQAHLDVLTGQREYNADLQSFRQAASVAQFQSIASMANAQMQALVLDQTQAIPAVGKAQLAQLQQMIAKAQQYGQNVTKYQQELAQDTQALPKATTLSAYLGFADQLDSQINGIQLTLAQGQANHDLQTLEALITQVGNQEHFSNGWPADYSYNTTLSDMQNEYSSAQSVSDFQSADNDINIQITNLKAAEQDYYDTTSHSQPHKTDLSLIKSYGLTGKVIVVSIWEQTARMYDNGQMVKWAYVTTGRIELPSPPGLWHVFLKQSPTVFTSSEPPGSPFYYAPTPINYALEYHPGGFYLHDAWWRQEFGPGTNLPHYDPAAFNGGSHGCINFTTPDAHWLYDWAPLGTPVILY
jgi:lipoprotein-anchoring transpeptidase ErfK/SrfK